MALPGSGAKNLMCHRSIPCSPECKIVRQILLDHPLSYALTATANVPIVYLQQFWRTVSKVPGPKFPDIPQSIEEDYHSIKDDIPLVSVYTTGNVLIRGMLIPDAFFTIEICTTTDFKEYETMFMNVDVPINQPQPVVSTQGTHRSTPRAHRTPTLTARDDRERDAIAEATLLSLALHKNALATEAQENVAKVQEKLDDEEIEKMVEGEEDEESYASVFADFVFNDGVDDSGTKIEPGSHKEHPEYVTNNDEEIEKEKKDEKEKDIADDGTGSKEIRKEQKQTPIPSPTRSPRNVSSSDKTVFEELTATISPTTATTSKDSSTTKRKKRSFLHMIKILLGSIVGMCRRHGQIRSHIKNKFITYEFFMSKIQEVLDHCNKVLPETIFEKTNEMIRNEMPCLVNLAINKDRVVDPINAKEMIAKEFATHGPKMIEELFRRNMQNTTLNLYPTTSMSTAGKSFADLQHQLYLIMKSKPQDQAANPEI
ncbi:hypothetical protein Tco_0377932 [Tanacetum coccineum]